MMVNRHILYNINWAIEDQGDRVRALSSSS